MLNFKISTLKNGIRLISCPVDSTEATTFQILVGSGGRFDPLAKSGISHFLEHMILTGSKKYPSFAEITRGLDSIGAGYNATTSYEAIRFYVQTDFADFHKGYDIIRDCFVNPRFSEEFVERERGVILEEIKMYRDMPQAWVGILNQNQAFPGHSLGADLAGTTETVNSISRDDLVNNWREHFSPRSTIIALTGKFDERTLQAVVCDFENIPEMEVKKFATFDEKNFKPSVKQEVRKIDQANFVISFPSIKKPDQRRFALNIMDLLLGSSPSSRLYGEIREKRGLAYDVGSGSNSYFDTGTYYVYGGVKADKMEEVYQLVMDELAKLKRDGISSEELERAKGNLRGSTTRHLESSFAIADYLTGSLYWHKEILPIDKYLENYNAVTAEEIKALAQEIFDEKKAIVTIVGPKRYKI